MNILHHITAKRYQGLVLVLLMVFLLISTTFAQESTVSIVPLTDLKSDYVAPVRYGQNTSNSRYVSVSNTSGILQDSPSGFTLELGDILPEEDLVLPNSIFLESFNIMASDVKHIISAKDRDHAIDLQFATYRCSLGDEGWINLNFSQIGVMGLLRSGSRTFVIQPVPASESEPQPDRSKHIIYEMSDSVFTGDWCGVDTDFLPDQLRKFMSDMDVLSAQKSVSAQLTVQLALETDYETYVSFGSDSLVTTAYLLSIAASASQFYIQEVDIKLEVAYSRVWTTPEDPYTEKGYSLYSEFRDYWNANMQDVDRDVALLIIKDPSRLAGGMASLDALCNIEAAYAISGENIGVVVHELGHVFGAPHTHNCSWPAGPNGTLAPIDSCASVEGDCGIEEIVSREGTIMSYCPTKRDAFHPLVQSLIRDKADANPCIGDGTELSNTISGMVTWNGQGLPNVIVEAYRDDWEISDTTDANGSYSLPVYIDAYNLAADRDSFHILPVGYTRNLVSVLVSGEDTIVVNFEASELLADQYEPDNTVEEASPIPADGSIQHHTMHIHNDSDYMEFQAEAGQTYILVMHSEQEWERPSFALLDTDGTTQIEWGWDYIEWKADRSGTYFIDVAGSYKGNYGFSVSPTPFSQNESEILPLLYSSAAWGDYDGDRDMDLVIAGRDSDWNHIIATYENDGGSLIQSQIGIESLSSDGVIATSLEWSDFDNDGDMDALIAYGYQVNIYINDEGIFPSRISIDDDLRLVSIAAWGDYDSDGDLDILVQSRTDMHSHGDYPLIRLYRNDNSTFSDTNLGLRGVDHGKTAWGDYDNDGDLDIIVAGASSIYGEMGGSAYNPFIEIYENHNGTFVDADVELEPVTSFPDFAFGDYDSDGDLDLAVAGMTESKLSAIIYRNDNGVYTNINAGLTGVRNSSLAWGDYDNDGDLDLLVSGMETMGATATSLTKLYDNQGGIFIESPGSVILPDIVGAVSWSDYDEDGDLDLFLIGEARYGGGLATLISNVTTSKNYPPSEITGLSETEGNDSVNLFWDSTLDDKTPSAGLSYNLRIGTSPGGIDFVAPNSDVGSGSRQIVRMGNAGQLTQHSFYELQPNTYYWSVQAIDNSFAGSEWAEEQSFTILNDPLATVEVSGESSNTGFNFYPNPAGDFVILQFDQIEAGNIEISSQDGKIVDSYNFSGRTHEIDISTYDQGIYFLIIRSENLVVTEKIIKL